MSYYDDDFWPGEAGPSTSAQRHATVLPHGVSARDLAIMRRSWSPQAVSRHLVARKRRSPTPSLYVQTKKAKKVKRRRERLRSPTTPLSPIFRPYNSPPPIAYFAPSPPQPLPSKRFSLLSLLEPSWPFLIMIIAGAVTVIYVSKVVMPITEAVGHAVDRIFGINPIEAVGAVLGPATSALASIPVTAIWCGGIGIGCPGIDRNEAYTTTTYLSLEQPQGDTQISLGHDFFDCLNDLRFTRQQKMAVSHLLTLAPKVMQYEHVLLAPEELQEHVMALANARRDIILNANAARVTGAGGVGKVVNEWENARDLSVAKLSRSDIQEEIREGLASARSSLQETADYTLASSAAVKAAAELANIVAEQAHREISRLRRINNDSEKGLKYLAYGWTEPAWKWVQPGLKGYKQDRILAGEFLKELVRVVDEGAQVLLLNTLSLQQCAVNTRKFNEEVERAFAFKHPEISFESEMKRLLPKIEGLGNRLNQLHKSDETLALAAPASQSPAASKPTGGDTPP